MSTTKSTGKRKRVTWIKPSLEQRLIKLELLYRNDVQSCFANSFTKGIVKAVGLGSEIFRLTPVVQIEWKIEKEELCHLLYDKRKTERENGTFTAACDLSPIEVIERLDTGDNNQKCDGKYNLAADEEYHREVVGLSDKVGSKVHQAMHGIARLPSRIDPVTDIRKLLLGKNHNLWEDTISSKQKAISDGEEPVSSPGISQLSNFSPIGAEGHQSLSLLDTQSPTYAVSDSVAIEILESIKTDNNIDDNEINGSQGLSPSQLIINCLADFEVSDEINNKSHPPEVKDVSCDFLYCYHPFLHCLSIIEWLYYYHV